MSLVYMYVVKFICINIVWFSVLVFDRYIQNSLGCKSSVMENLSCTVNLDLQMFGKMAVNRC